MFSIKKTGKGSNQMLRVFRDVKKIFYSVFFFFFSSLFSVFLFYILTYRMCVIKVSKILISSRNQNKKNFFFAFGASVHDK